MHIISMGPRRILAPLACLAALSIPMTATADLPRTLVWTAYDVGSAGYAQAASIGHVMAEKEGVTLRVIPAGNDVARQSPIAAGRAHFGALGIATFLSQEGIMEFSAPEWGPQPTRILNLAWANFNTGNPACGGDTGAKTVYDMKGLRMGWVIGGPALNIGMTGFLAAGDLTWDDVVKIEFPSWGAMARAVREGQADCFIASTNSGAVYELADSPRRYLPPAMPRPEEDPEAWERFLSITPYFSFNEATIGAAPISEDNPHLGATFGYPIIATYARQNPDLVYHQTRMIVEYNEDYRDAFPGNDGFALENQRFSWVVPYHEGAVRYYTEAGVWNEEHEQHNQSLVRRQEVLAEAWEQALAQRDAEDIPIRDFPALWMKLRVAALEAEGFEPYWREVFW